MNQMVQRGSVGRQVVFLRVCLQQQEAKLHICFSGQKSSEQGKCWNHGFVLSPGTSRNQTGYVRKSGSVSLNSWRVTEASG